MVSLMWFCLFSLRESRVGRSLDAFLDPMNSLFGKSSVVFFCTHPLIFYVV